MLAVTPACCPPACAFVTSGLLAAAAAVAAGVAGADDVAGVADVTGVGWLDRVSVGDAGLAVAGFDWLV